MQTFDENYVTWNCSYLRRFIRYKHFMKLTPALETFAYFAYLKLADIYIEFLETC